MKDLDVSVMWAACEVLNGGESSVSSDAWGFGVLIVECLVREDPFAGLVDPRAIPIAVNAGQCALDHVSAEGAKRLGKMPAELSDKLQKLARHCWKRDPYDRPSFSKILKRINRIASVSLLYCDCSSLV